MPLSSDPVTFAAGSADATVTVLMLGADTSGVIKTFGLEATDAASSDANILGTDEFTLLPPPQPPTATALGCPHFTTYDGLNFDFQGAGEFVAAKSTKPGDTFQVQMRIEPEGSVDSAVSIITQIAVEVGDDRVTFAADRPQVVWVDGTPAAISTSNPVIKLSGGTVTEVSQNEYRVVLNTGEEVTVNPYGDGMGLTITLSPTDASGSIQGFFGPDEGQANDFQLPDGTVLQQPLTQTQLYQTFANAWRVTDATSLLDYGPGQDTETFTNTMYPREVLTLADFPSALVSEAASLAAAAGITDPTLAADAEFDYITMGDPSFFSEDASVASLSSTVATPAVITEPVAPPPSIGVLPADPEVVEASGTTTTVTFIVNLTSAAPTATEVDYAVVAPSGTPDGKSFLDAADFGGTLPSGSVTIAAGEMEADITIDVPNSAIGSVPNKWVLVNVTSLGGDPVYDPEGQTEILNNQPVAGTPADPVISLLANATPTTSEYSETLSQSGTDYAVDLGQVLYNAGLPALQFAIANMATPPADDLSSEISGITGTGFTLSGTVLPATIAAEDTYQGLFFQPDTATLGAQSESLTVTSSDVNDTGYSAVLPDMTLTVEDTVVAPAQAVFSTQNIQFPNVRVGTPESQTITVTNSAAAPAANLDVTPTAGPGATASGSVSQLARGASDSTDLSVGLATSTAGLQTGTVTLNLFSDLGNGVTVPALPSPQITVTGSVYREASAAIAVSDPIVHVGDPGTDTLTVTNTAATDGYSENLIAALASATEQIGVASAGPTGEIAAGASDTTSLAVSFSTATAGTVSGTATVDLTSDGGTGAGSIDGLGQIALPAQEVPVSITVNNYATAGLSESGGGVFAAAGTNSAGGANYTLDLGTLAEGSSAPTIDLSALNTASGPADLLSGSFQATGSSAFTNALSSFNNLSAGDSDPIGTLTLDTASAGAPTETVTFDPTDSNASGYSAPLDPITLTVTGTVGEESVSWTNSAGGDWTTGSDWSTGTVPTPTDTVAIDAPGSYTVAIGSDQTVTAAGLIVAGGVTLSVGAGGGLDLSSPLSIAGTLVNAGTVSGGGATAVTFASITDRLILDPGATFTGAVVGSGANTTLELAQGTSPGTLNALGTTFTDFGTVIVDAGATWTVDAVASALAGTTITGNGGSTLLDMISAGTFSLGQVSDISSIQLAAGDNTVTVGDATLSGGSVALHDGPSGNNAVVALDTAASAGKTLYYFAGTTGTDSFTGGSENDTITIGAGAALGGDTLTGGSGRNAVVMTRAGTVNLDGVSKFLNIYLAAGNNSVTVTNTTLSGGALGLYGGASGNNTVVAVDTEASEGTTLYYISRTTGTDSFTGGSENDTIYMAAGSALGGDALTGGSGTNAVVMTSAGTVDLDGVSKFPNVYLASGNNTVTVTDTTLSGGSVALHDGASGNNSVSAAGDTAASKGTTLYYVAGTTGTDSFTGGSRTTRFMRLRFRATC